MYSVAEGSNRSMQTLFRPNLLVRVSIRQCSGAPGVGKKGFFRQGPISWASLVMCVMVTFYCICDI